MSEEIKLTPSEFERLKELIDSMNAAGEDRVKVRVLTLYFRDILYKLGYSDKDTISIQEIEKALSANLWSMKNQPTRNAELFKEDTITDQFDSGRDWSAGSENGRNWSEIDFDSFVAIIKRIVPSIYPRQVLPIYVLYHKGKMSKSALRAECERVNQALGLRYSTTSIKNSVNELAKDHLLVNKHIIDGEEFLELSSSLLSDIKFYLRELEVKKEEEEKLKKVEKEEIIKAFVEFFSSYADENGKPIYIEKLKDLLTLKSTHSLVVDWKHLASFNPWLADELINNPTEIIEAAEDAVQVVLKEPPIERKDDFKVNVRFSNLPWTLKVKDVGSDHINKLIQVEGVVSRQVEHRPFVQKAVFLCKGCGNEMTRLQKPYEPISQPLKCDACGSRNIELNVDKSVFIDAQWFRIQDLPEGSEGMVSRFIKAIALGELVDTFLPGDKVRVVGILRVRMARKNGLPILEKILEVNNIEVLTKRIQDVELDEARIQQIREVAKKKNIVELITNSIAPSILGYEDVKKGIALALFSGGDVIAPDGTITRGASHVLLVGDPGTAKSTISRFLKQVIPRGIWTTAKTSSAAGLTATAVQDKETGTWTLEAGALVLANGGICVIDEFDKMNDKDRAAIHEALEQGTISLSKAGINVVLPAKTTVIAIGNPKYGRFDPNRDKDKPLVSQIDLPPTLLSRFDLIFPIIDVPEEEKDKDIADHILRFKVGVLETEEPKIKHLPVDLLRDYIAYARNYVNPVLTKDAYQFLVDYYAKTRSRAVNEDGTIKTIPITARQLEGLWRLARARARMRLSERIELEDVNDVVALFERNMRRLITDEEGEWDVTILEAGKSTREIDREATAVSIIEKLEEESEEGAPYEDVVELLAQKLNAPKNEAKKVIERLIEDGRIYMPRVGFLRISPDE